MTSRQVAGPEGPFRSRLRVPGDKSLSHRALLLAAMAEGRSGIRGLGPGADVAATGRAVASLGARLEDGALTSPGVEGWRDPGGPLDAGNSATTLRLLSGALSGRPFRVVLVGDDSLMGRPMERLVGPLGALGAEVAVGEGGTPPVTVGGGALRGAEVVVPIASAQLRSAVELAALQAEGRSTVDSPPGFRDHTERWLAALGLGRWVGATRFEVMPGPVPPASYDVPGDPSSAAFLWTAAALVPGAEVVVEGVSLNPGRTGFLEVLGAMGAVVEAEETGSVHGEPVGAVRVRGAGLEGTTVSADLTVRCLDELPLVAVLGTAATGVTEVRDAGELRVKESDRVASTVAMVLGLGGVAEERPDGFRVEGTGRLPGGVVSSGGDHRIAMAGAVAAAAAAGPVTVEGAESTAVSWPGFFEALEGMWSSP